MRRHVQIMDIFKNVTTSSPSKNYHTLNLSFVGAAPHKEPRKTMRRGVLMSMLQKSAQTLPLWIGKPGEELVSLLY